jgi:hypothetical protein
MKYLPYSWISKNNIVKIAILSKGIYMFSAIPIKIPMIFIMEIEKSILKFIWKHKQKTANSQEILSKNTNFGCFTIFNFKL